MCTSGSNPRTHRSVIGVDCRRDARVGLFFMRNASAIALYACWLLVVGQLLMSAAPALVMAAAAAAADAGGKAGGGGSGGGGACNARELVSLAFYGAFRTPDACCRLALCAPARCVYVFSAAFLAHKHSIPSTCLQEMHPVSARVCRVRPAQVPFGQRDGSQITRYQCPQHCSEEPCDFDPNTKTQRSVRV